MQNPTPTETKKFNERIYVYTDEPIKNWVTTQAKKNNLSNSEFVMNVLATTKKANRTMLFEKPLTNRKRATVKDPAAKAATKTTTSTKKRTTKAAKELIQ